MTLGSNSVIFTSTLCVVVLICPFALINSENYSIDNTKLEEGTRNYNLRVPKVFDNFQVLFGKDVRGKYLKQQSELLRLQYEVLTEVLNRKNLTKIVEDLVVRTSELSLLETEYVKQGKQLQKVQKDYDDLKSRVSKLESKMAQAIGTLSTKDEQLSNDIKTLRDEGKNTKEIMDLIKNDIKVFKGDNEEINKAQNKRVDVLKDTMQRLSRDFVDFKSQENQTNALFAQVVIESKANVSKLNARSEKMNATLKETVRDLTAITKLAFKLNLDADYLNKTVDKLKTELDYLKQIAINKNRFETEIFNVSKKCNNSIVETFEDFKRELLRLKNTTAPRETVEARIYNLTRQLNSVFMNVKKELNGTALKTNSFIRELNEIKSGTSVISSLEQQIRHVNLTCSDFIERSRHVKLAPDGEFENRKMSSKMTQSTHKTTVPITETVLTTENVLNDGIATTHITAAELGTTTEQGTIPNKKSTTEISTDSNDGSSGSGSSGSGASGYYDTDDETETPSYSLMTSSRDDISTPETTDMYFEPEAEPRAHFTTQAINDIPSTETQFQTAQLYDNPSKTTSELPSSTQPGFTTMENLETTTEDISIQGEITTELTPSLTTTLQRTTPQELTTVTMTQTRLTTEYAPIIEVTLPADDVQTTSKSTPTITTVHSATSSEATRLTTTTQQTSTSTILTTTPTTTPSLTPSSTTPSTTTSGVYVPIPRFDCPIGTKIAIVEGQGEKIFQRWFSGAWMKDPGRPTDNVYLLKNNVNIRYIITYASMAGLRGDRSQLIHLPFACAGTGHVVFDNHLYCSKNNSNVIIKASLANTTDFEELELSGAGFSNTYHYSVGTMTDIDFAVDEQGMWVIYATNHSHGSIVLSKLDPDLFKIEKTWHTPIIKKEVSNTFMINGTLFAINSHYESSTYVKYIYSTELSAMRELKSIDIELPLFKPYTKSFTTIDLQIDYNPRDEQFYIWRMKDWDGHLVSYKRGCKPQTA